MKYVSSGTELYCIRGEPVPAKEGQFVIIPKNTEYSAHGYDSVTKGICIDLTDKVIENEAFCSRLPLNTPIDCYGLSGIGKLMYPIQSRNARTSGSLDKNRLSFESFLKSITESVITLGVDIELVVAALAKDVRKQNTRMNIALKLLHVRDFIRARYFEKISLCRLEMISGLSKHHLTRLFKASFGKTPRAYLEETRMRVARKMVLEQLSLK
ncbi:AraC family transcriptional regulator [Puniceicoccaceae bacterium K14]|nr:AraC family transcriptional regulator [Puniceicoccaceae bacterium K14]